jgi:curli biogenesis system outer membrane secretion channel CsgG
MSFTKTAAVVLAAVALVACSKTSATTGSGATATSAGASPEDVPPSERHADRNATNEITPTNYKIELSKIDKELGP